MTQPEACSLENRIVTDSERKDAVYQWCVEMMESGAKADEFVVLLKELITVLEADFV